MSIEPLTDQEIEFLKANPVFARHAIASAVHAAETPVYRGSGEPVDEASFHLSQSINKRLSFLRKWRGETEVMQNKMGQKINEAPDINSSFHTNVLIKSYRARAERLNLLGLDIEALERKVTMLSTSPVDMYLPLGAVVRFKHPMGRGHYTGNADLPMWGTLGVVTELKRSGEFAVGVSVFENFTTEKRVSCLANNRSFESFDVDADMLDVIEYAKLPDGSEFRGYGYLPTYADAQSLDVKDGHMVLAAADRYLHFGIKIDDYGREQGVEFVAADDSLWECKWLGDPIPYEPENSTSTMKL